MRLPRMTTRRWTVAVAIVGLVSGLTIELVRRRQRFLRAYRGQALAEFECSVKAQILIGTMAGKGSDLPSLTEVASMLWPGCRGATAPRGRRRPSSHDEGCGMGESDGAPIAN
jgi:hypothetical protein